MKSYNLYIKSHCEAPDIDMDIDADDFEQAVARFDAMTFGEFDKKELEKHINCDDECPECHTTLKECIELRDGYLYEHVWICQGCGFTATRRGI